MQEAGQLAASINRQNGTMHDSMSYKIIRKAPGAARSLAFSNFWGYFEALV
jgi:hypothetical protein